MATNVTETLPQLLRFRPWPQGDPVAPWLVDILDKVQLAHIAAVELELNKTMLEAQLKANAQMMDIVRGVK